MWSAPLPSGSLRGCAGTDGRGTTSAHLLSIDGTHGGDEDGITVRRRKAGRIRKMIVQFVARRRVADTGSLPPCWQTPAVSEAPGWDAIERAIASVHPGVTPIHFGGE